MQAQYVEEERATLVAVFLRRKGFHSLRMEGAPEVILPSSVTAWMWK